MHNAHDKTSHIVLTLSKHEIEKETSHTTVNYMNKQGELRVSAKIRVSDQVLDLTIDTGAQISTLRPCKLFGNTEVNCNERIPIMGIAKDLTLFTLGQIETEIYFNDISFKHEFHIVQDKFNIPNDGIIGNDFLTKYGAVIDYERNRLILQVPENNVKKEKQAVIDLQNEMQTRRVSNSSVRKKGDRNYFKYNDVLVKPNTEIVPLKTITIDIDDDDIFESLLNDNDASKMANIKIASIDSTEITDAHNRREYLMSNLDIGHCEEMEKIEMTKICEQYGAAFYIDGDKLNHTDVISHFIALKPGTSPIFTRQYRIPETQRGEIQRQIDELEMKGIIEKSNSAWNSPLLLVPKKDNKEGGKEYRMVIDFRKLNAVTIPHSYPIPLIDEKIDQMVQDYSQHWMCKGHFIKSLCTNLAKSIPHFLLHLISIILIRGHLVSLVVLTHGYAQFIQS